MEVVGIRDQGHQLAHFQLDPGVAPCHPGGVLTIWAVPPLQRRGLVLALGRSSVESDVVGLDE